MRQVFAARKYDEKDTKYGANTEMLTTFDTTPATKRINPRNVRLPTAKFM